jgi:hypothetical protein
MNFLRIESKWGEKVSYAPNDKAAEKLCDVLGYSDFLPSESAMDRVWDLMHELGVEVQISEDKTYDNCFFLC